MRGSRQICQRGSNPDKVLLVDEGGEMIQMKYH